MSSKALREERAPIVKQMSDMVAASGKEKRPLNEEEKQKFDAMDADQGRLLKAAEESEKMAKMTADLDSPITKGETDLRKISALPGRGNTDPGKPGADGASAYDHEMGLRAFLLGGPHTRGNMPGHIAEAATKAGVDYTNPSLQYRLAAKAPKTIDDANGMTVYAATTAQSLTAGAGGNTVPNEMMRELEIGLLAHGGMRQVATVLRTETGATLPIPTTNETASGAILSENSAAVTEDLAFGQVTLGAHKYSSNLVLVSVELLQDSSIDLVGYIGTELGTRIARIQNNHFTVGSTSTTNPRGLVTQTTTGVITASATGFTLNELFDLEHAVDPAYRARGAQWMFRDATLKILKQMTDAEGRPLWQPGMITGSPDMINGHKYVINQDMPTVSGATTLPLATIRRAITFGDHSKYIIRDVMGVDLLRLDERYANLHQTAFLAFTRSDGKSVWPTTASGAAPVQHLRVST